MVKNLNPDCQKLIWPGLIASALFVSCVSRPFVPVNVGREYGNPTTPWVVSHAVKKNQWALARTKPHNVFQRILCFSYPCRKMIGRRKTLRAISFDDFKKRIAKNAKKGYYKNIVPIVTPVQKPKQDTVKLKDTTRVTLTKPVSVALASPPLKADSLITLNEFLFETNSYHLKGKDFAQLDSIAKFLLDRPALEVSVSGHTDNTGNERHNVSLSTKRAEVVAQYLIAKGVSDDRVFFEGFGSSKPVSTNDTAESRGKNRRVEILIRNAKR